MSGLAEAWERLNTAGHGLGDYVRLRLPAVSACPTYAAKRLSDDSVALILEIDKRVLSGLPDLPASKRIRALNKRVITRPIWQNATNIRSLRPRVLGCLLIAC